MIQPILESLRALSGRVNEPEAGRLLDAVEASLKRQSFHTAVLGEFKRGKSSFINTLLGRELLRTDLLPATAVLHMLEYGDEEEYDIIYLDGTIHTQPLDEEGLAELAVGGSIAPEQVRYVRVKLNSPLLRDGLVLIDTPGVNDMNQARAEVTYTILPNCDAALFLLDAAAPLTRSEADFLKTKVLQHKLSDLLFILSKSDRLDEEELGDALEGASGRIREVLGRTVPVLPFSSREAAALQARGKASQEAEELLRHLAELREKAGRSAQRRQAERLLLAADELLEAIGWQEAAHRSNQVLAQEHRTRLDRVLEEMGIRFERLMAGVDSVGRDGLMLMMDQAYQKLEDMLVHDMRYDIQTRGGNLERLMDRDLPLYIERMLRQFSEMKAMEVSIYLERFQKHTAEEYQRHFRTPLQLAMEELGFKIPMWQASVAPTPSSQVDTIIRHAAPATALAVAGSFIMPGVGTIIGAAVGGVLTSVLRSKQMEQMRSEVLERLPELVHEIVSAHRIETIKTASGWFDEMKTALRSFHERQLDRMSAMFEANIAKPDYADAGASAEELQSCRQQLLDIRGTLEALLSAAETNTREES
ncbi:dynamin family protein [Paenibacillus puerhi]|uniref:dynamin family protein n=1 Tax=Paenibacillus puerhi TaxID=2692622 RepID=UPI00135C4FC7|nr:dynamin family protein [Paenibacillus puerhi]